MLVLSRKIGETVVLPTCGVAVTVVATRGNRVRLGIVAPPEVAVHRSEILNTPSKAGAPTGDGTALKPRHASRKLRSPDG